MVIYSCWRWVPRKLWRHSPNFFLFLSIRTVMIVVKVTNCSSCVLCLFCLVRCTEELERRRVRHWHWCQQYERSVGCQRHSKLKLAEAHVLGLRPTNVTFRNGRSRQQWHWQWRQCHFVSLSFSCIAGCSTKNSDHLVKINTFFFQCSV